MKRARVVEQLTVDENGFYEFAVTDPYAAGVNVNLDQVFADADTVRLDFKDSVMMTHNNDETARRDVQDDGNDRSAAMASSQRTTEPSSIAIVLPFVEEVQMIDLISDDDVVAETDLDPESHHEDSPIFGAAAEQAQQQPSYASVIVVVEES